MKFTSNFSTDSLERSNTTEGELTGFTEQFDEEGPGGVDYRIIYFFQIPENHFPKHVRLDMFCITTEGNGVCAETPWPRQSSAPLQGFATEEASSKLPSCCPSSLKATSTSSIKRHCAASNASIPLTLIPFTTFGSPKILFSLLHVVVCELCWFSFCVLSCVLQVLGDVLTMLYRSIGMRKNKKKVPLRLQCSVSVWSRFECLAAPRIRHGGLTALASVSSSRLPQLGICCCHQFV